MTRKGTLHALSTPTQRPTERDTEDSAGVVAPMDQTTLVTIDGAATDQLMQTLDPGDPRGERIRLLRTELMLRHDTAEGANIIAVVSPCPREGRSQLAAELAVSFSALGRPTLLVDADLRAPRQHLLFRTSNRGGLSAALAEESPPRLHGMPRLPALSLLTSGARQHNPLELLSGAHFERLVEDWRRSFEFVVVDTPPAGTFADGLAVAAIVGRVLSLSRTAHTSYQEMRDMLRRLGATQARILGAVISEF